MTSIGKIVTFYSWKGGVGRTMALANTAIQLCRKGNRVLMIDWDLEAPGLLDYFSPSKESEIPGLKIKVGKNAGGFLSLFEDGFKRGSGCLDEVLLRASLTSIRVPSDPKTYSNPFPPTPGKLDLLPSGFESKEYSKRLSAFSWNDFFERRDGGKFLESCRQRWSNAYDFVLIDARTGLTDSGGICTIQMPDYVVLVFTPNNQSLKGGLAAISAAQSARKDFAFERSPLAVIPMLSRWDGEFEVDIAEQWIKQLDSELKSFMASWLPRDFSPRDFIEKFRVPHVPRFSFGEPLPVLTHGLSDTNLPGLTYDRLAVLLAEKLANAGVLIDPRYTTPAYKDELTDQGSAAPYKSGFAVGDEAQMLSLVMDEVALNKEIARIARVSGDDPKKLSSFLVRAAVAARQLAKYETAERLFRRAIQFTKSSGSNGMSLLGVYLTFFGELMTELARFDEAESLLREAIDINEAQYGSTHQEVGRSLTALAQVFARTNRLDLSKASYIRAMNIAESVFGNDSAQVATVCSSLASVLTRESAYQEAEALHRRAIAIDERLYGSNHPEVATDLSNLGTMLGLLGEDDEAESLLRRALSIDEKSFGPDHPNVAVCLNNLAVVVVRQGDFAEARSLLERALQISLAALGESHPAVEEYRQNLAAVEGQSIYKTAAD